MKTIRVVSTKKNRKGWRFRITNPATRKRTWKTFWFRDLRDAEKARDKFLEGLERRKIGMADNSGWTMPFTEAMEKFLEEAPIASERRRVELRHDLERNDLGLHTLADFGNKGKLTAKCVALARQRERGDEYVRKHIQQPLKQVAAWAASIDLLPHNPLDAWKLLPRTSAASRRRAFQPEEVAAVLAAAGEWDAFLGRSLPTSLIFRALLISGNRPGAVLGAKVGHLDREACRIILPPGTRTKKNGMAFLPADFVVELEHHLARRGRPGADAPLFVSPEGSAVDPAKLSRDFSRALTLAGVRKCWPAPEGAEEEADPLAVASLIYIGRQHGFDGAPPRDPAKLAERARIMQVNEDMAAKIKADVARFCENRDMYALRKTHISWARRLVNADSVKLQVGHAPQDVEERHYLDLVDARESAQAVWDVLTGVRTLDGKQREPESLALAAGAENLQTMDYVGDYGAKTAAETRTGKARTTRQVVEVTNLRKVKGAGIEPATNGLKIRCSTY